MTCIDKAKELVELTETAFEETDSFQKFVIYLKARTTTKDFAFCIQVFSL